MTRVALVWHMHQPFYVDGSTGVHVLPWVRLHGLKDYWGMAAVAREFPALRLTFNLVPSLLEQLEAFARSDARDPHLELGLRPAEDLTPGEAASCVNEFFHAQYERMIRPHARYAELLERRREMRAGGPAFSTDELRDLQVWHKLVWVDPLYVDDPRVAALVRRGRAFTEADKLTLREVELEVLRRVIPEYRLRGRKRARRAIHLAVLPPDSAAAVRPVRLPDDAPRMARSRRTLCLPVGRGATRSVAPSSCTRAFSARRRQVSGRPRARSRTPR